MNDTHWAICGILTLVVMGCAGRVDDVDSVAPDGGLDGNPEDAALTDSGLKDARNANVSTDSGAGGGSADGGMPEASPDGGTDMDAGQVETELVTVGYPAPDFEFTQASNLLYGVRIDDVPAGQVEGVGVVVQGGSSSANIAIYTHGVRPNGSVGPLAKVLGSELLSATLSPDSGAEVVLFLPGNEPVVEAGTYWVFVVLEEVRQILLDTSRVVSVCQRATDFAATVSSMPSDLSGLENCGPDNPPGIYLIVETPVP